MNTFAHAGANSETTALVEALQRREGLTLCNRFRLAVWPVISPDATAACWHGRADDVELVGPAFTTLGLRGGVHQVRVGSRTSTGLFGISSGAAEIVAEMASPARNAPKSFLFVDVSSGRVINDITSSVARPGLPGPETVSVSGTGGLAAFGFGATVKVVDLLSGREVYSAFGRFPRLSPDAKRLAFVQESRLHVVILGDGKDVELLPQTSVMGVGGWSPNGRFLWAGARTKVFAFHKQRIVVDTLTGQFGDFGGLGEGDYGNNLVWISRELLSRLAGVRGAGAA